MTTSLSNRQQAILDALRTSIAAQGFPPTLRQLGKTVGLSSPSSVKHQLGILEQLGYIRRVPGLPRAIEICQNEAASLSPNHSGAAQSFPSEAVDPLQTIHNLSTDSNTALVPLVGRIAAGGPILATQEITDNIAISNRFTGHGNLFMLEVVGESMLDAAICPGDFVIVRQQQVAEEGEIVAAMLDGEATVKVFSRRGGHIWLLPRNPHYEPILGDEAKILGKVVTVLRAL